MKKNTGFRGWFYFRQGWSLYFAFIFAAVNTLTVTYYLAIERVPILVGIFPSFVHYVIIVGIFAIPILIFVGYVHFKRTAAYGAEANIVIEANPFQRRILVNSELLLDLNLKLIQILSKSIDNIQLSDVDKKEYETFVNTISEFVKTRTFENKKDLEYLKTIFKTKNE
jgi:hypothetical protein